MTPTVVPLRHSAVEASLKCAAFDELPLPALCISSSAQLLAVNAAASRLLDVPVEQLTGTHVSMLVGYPAHRDSARRWGRLWSALQSRGRLCTLAKVPLRDGRRLALRIDAQLLRVDLDSFAVVALTDITERRRADRARHRAERRVRSLLKSGPSVIFLLGADRRVLDIVGAADGLGFSGADDLRGVPFELLLDDRSSAALLEALDRIAEPGGPAVLTVQSRGRGSAAANARIELALSDHRADPAIGAIVAHARAVPPVQGSPVPTDVAQRRLRAVIDGAADLLMVLDTDGCVRYQAPGIRRVLSVSPEETLNRPVWDIPRLQDQATLRRTIDAARSDHAGVRAHTCLVRADAAGEPARQLWIGVRNYANDPSVGGLLLSARDVSAAMPDASAADSRFARRLELRERLLDLAIHARADFAASLARTLRAAAETLKVSAASFWRRGDTMDELCCEALFDRRSGRFVRDCIGFTMTASTHPEQLARLRDRETIVAGDARVERKTVVPVDWLLARGMHAAVEVPVLLDGDVKGLLAMHDEQPRAWDPDDVDFAATAGVLLGLSIEAAQRQEAESRIEQLAWYDSLTGLPNRNLLRESMRDMIMTAANRRRRIALMLIDLDRFKDVNDTLGHLVGDALIKSAAGILKETVGDVGMVARLGGDEFVVLVNEFKHRQEVALLAARIAQAMHRTDLVPNVDTQVSASIGVALFPEHGREMSTLLKNADAAMYQAKRDGRNQFSFFNPIRHELAAREVQLGIQLLKALQGESTQFFVEYQPQVEIGSGRVVGFEALIRWAHPTFGLLTPDRFIGVAEVSGLSERITRWVVNEVCAQLVRWREDHPGFDIPVAINVAGRELGSAALPAIVRAALLRHAIDAHLLTLEITERTFVREGEVNNDVITELASLGVGLSLDDFGTGYSMLGYLKRMPIQSLKIDQSFIEGLPRDADSCAIVHAMLAVARHFRLKVIAEGVETAEQADYLRSIGCEFAQGYYYARALSAQKIIDFIQHEAAQRG